jgi:transcriptional regulator GlxA family with amidase domain
VRIKAPWYASSIAYAIYGLLAIGLVAMVFYLIDRRRQRQLEEEKMRFLLNLKKDVKRALKPVNVKGNNKALLDRIMKSVNENLSNPDFNVEQLAQDVGVSRAQLHRKMKEMTGVSTGDFIRNLRLDQAAALIVEGKVNVTQVAYSVGFNNQSHFSTIFRKHFGLTPSEYAVVHRKENEN